MSSVARKPVNSASRLATALSAVMRSEAQDFATLTRVSGLDPWRDFRNADLSGADLRDTDLTGFDFTHARFRGARISGARFNDSVSAAQLNEALLDPDPPIQPSRPDILVVGFGPRAEEILRHVEVPDWYPAFGREAEEWRFETTTEPMPAKSRDLGRIRAVPGSAFDDIAGFDVVVVLVDDETDLNVAMDRMEIARSVEQRRHQLFLLAPALPKLEPSGLFRANLDKLPGFAAIIDTSVARSPFWSGNPSRSVERRVADVLLGAAMLATALPDLQPPSSAGGACPLFTFGFSPDRGNDGRPQRALLPLSSEEIGLLHLNEKGFTTVGFKPVWLRQALKSARWGTMVLGARERGDVAGLFRAAAALASNSEDPTPLTATDPPPELLQLMPADAVVAAVRSDPGPGGGPLALIAQTPSLDLVRVMSGKGWKVARYTDTTFIQRAMSQATTSASDWLPEELELPPIARLRTNRGLVTRGADSRDVVTPDLELQQRLDREAPELRSVARYFRPAFFRDDEQPQLLLSTGDIDRWIETLAARPHLNEIEKLRDIKPRIPKRPADLRVVWRRPINSQRFVVADGLSPVLVDVLAPDEVPAQSMFVVDGDSAVPALLQSRVFEVWSRATASRSLSWMALRYAVTRTFETFPIETPFSVRHDPDGGSSLVFLEEKSRLAELSRRWLEHLKVDRPYAEGKREPFWSKEMLEVRAELDLAVLDIYGLDEGAPDVTILQRLLELNRR